MPHRFNVGKTVQLISSNRNANASGLCVIQKCLPEEAGSAQYRVKMTATGTERLVRETELAPA